MSTVKVVLLVALVLVLMPSNGQERYEFYATAQRTAADIGGFCTRNPDVCEKVTSSFQNIGYKIKSITDYIEDLLRDAGIAEDRTRLDTKYSEAYDQDDAEHPTYRSMPTSSFSGDTLTARDRKPVWRGPRHF